ncbi:Per1-like protein [Neolentinus lepideus HHB14362 ss-1]|uniref:Post-GPI attachment to proteins factor 3 n=1 Tax=Neolentinus lepideus HHB14362 ss-1 TaxID=1314782 RepID=A0A165NZ45_9AGAM|nr:Per1-like protein [Neolentinus lepideus HHB14362 ss-1]
MRPIHFLAVAGILGALQGWASSGDRSQEFQACVSLCTSGLCASHQVSLISRITRWSCIDECKYACMHQITSRDINSKVRLHQYYGKWPFWRFAGMQEPASVLFSLLNLWSHARGASRVRRKVPDDHPMKRFYLIWAAVGVNAWIWSSVFHTRDLSTTEKLDYFSAALAILYAVYYTVVRFFHIYPVGRANRLVLTTAPCANHSTAYNLWSVLCVVVYVSHVGYLLSLPRFDYTYNMIFNLTVGIFHNILWLLYSLPSWIPVLKRFPSRPRSYRPSYAGKAAIFVALTTLATALELFDFFPWWRVIDAHSLWHLSTIPITTFWYDFLIKDALDDGWRGMKA